MTATIIIPARRASTRLPDKMLLRETGRTLIEHTYHAAAAARSAEGVIVATDDLQICQEVRRFGGEAQLTSPDCPSGTDRVAEVAREMPEVEIVVNLQGDEPEIDPAAIDKVIEQLEHDPTAVMATLATPIWSRQQVEDPACVKVVFDDNGRALYFSRSPIPHVRDEAEWQDCAEPIYYQHIGLYAYRRDFLLELAATPPSKLEQLEKLEQLRVLQMGERISVGVVEHAAAGIDTPVDYAAFVARHRKAG